MKYILLIFLLLVSVRAQSQRIITLEDAMDVAMKNSPDILKSELQMTISRENLNAEEARTKSLIRFDVSPFSYVNNREYDRQGYWITYEEKGASGDFLVIQPIKVTNGSITLRNSFSYYDRFSEYQGFKTNLKGYVNDLTLSYAQPLFTYNRLKMQLKQLELALEDATLSYSIQRLFLERSVTQYFYVVYQRQLALDIAKEELKNQEVGYEIIKSKVDGGLSAMEELYQAELNLTTSRSNLQNALVNLANAEDDFAAYIGMPLGEDFEIQTNVEFSEVSVDLEKAIQNGLETRMELRQREINIDNSQDQLIQAKATNEFAGNANLSIGIKGEDPVLSEIYNRPTRTPMVGLTFSIPIWDWGERRSRIKAAEAMIRIEEINLGVEKTQVELGIREVFRNLQNLVLQIEIARQNEKNAQLTYDINLERYRNGDLTGMDLNLFQNQLSQKKIDLANSLISYRIELLNMKIQSLWDFENNISFVPIELQSNIKN